MSSEKAPENTTSRRRGFGVGGSPFNGVKLELVLIACLGLLLWAVVERAQAAPLTQLLLLGGYGLGGGVWIVLRTRRVLRAQGALSAWKGDGAQ